MGKRTNYSFEKQKKENKRKKKQAEKLEKKQAKKLANAETPPGEIPATDVATDDAETTDTTP